MCDSLRGGAYYGASVHLTVAIIFLTGFILDCAGIAEVWHNPHATYLTLILAFMYISLFLVFGLLVFRGIEQESVKILRGTVVGFLVLQFSAFLIYLGILILLSRRVAAEAAKNNIIEIRGNEIWSTVATKNDSQLETQLELPEADLFNITSSEDAVVRDSIGEDIQIITVPQIVGLIFGIIASLIYVIVLIVYIRNVGSEPRGRRS